MQKIYISGEISLSTAEAVRSQIDGFDRTLPLAVEVNSDGGSVADGITIFNMLRAWPGGITMEVVGWCLSIASVILQAGTTRRAHETALVMVHAPWTHTTGNSTALRDSASLLDQVRETMLIAYRRSGKPDTTINQWLDGTDHWFTAAEALAAGLIDEVITDSATQPIAPANAKASRHPVPSVLAQRIIMNATVNASTNTEAIRAAAVAAEGQRRNQIRASFKLHLTLPGVAELLSRCEQNAACTAEAAGLQLLAHIGAGATPIMGSYVPSYSQDTRMGDFKAAAQDVLLTRAGLKVGELHPGVRDLRRMGVVGLAEAILNLGGKSVRDLSPAGIISAAMSTSDFPSLLAATAGKALAIGYQSAPSGHAKFTGERDVPDFKIQTLVNLSQAPSLEVVGELGEYKNGGLSDGASTFQLTTFGKILSISRQALVNDDLSSFTVLPQSFGAAASRLEADKVFGLLTANANLGDGFALFSGQHGNLSTAAALSVASLGLARAAMRQQKGISGVDFIDPQPKYLIVPTALETTAEQLIASLVDPSRNNSTPSLEFIKNLELIADPRLDAASATAWYLSAAPTQMEGILRAYLAGEARPYLEEDSEFRRDAISYKVRLDFAAGVMEFRALHKNPGL